MSTIQPDRNHRMTEAVLTASQMADHVEAMIATHGDLPMMQWDHDTWWPYPTGPASIKAENDDETGELVLVTSHVGYHAAEDAETVSASRFVSDLREAIEAHGDLPMHQRDADTGDLMAFRGQTAETHEGTILITSEGY